MAQPRDNTEPPTIPGLLIHAYCKQILGDFLTLWAKHDVNWSTYDLFYKDFGVFVFFGGCVKSYFLSVLAFYLRLVTPSFRMMKGLHIHKNFKKCLKNYESRLTG